MNKAVVSAYTTGAKNTDTGWTVSVSRNGIDETATKRGKWSAEYRSLVSINDMLTNAVLLDTICVNKPSKRLGNSAAFVHYMYCPISIDGVNAIAKLYVTEEVGNINKFYLTKIEMVPTDSTVLGKNAFAPNSSVDTEISVADIYDFVKRNNDKYEADSDEPTSFNPKPVNPAMLNADGTPTVVYYGTDTDFNVFTSKDGICWFSESEDYPMTRLIRISGIPARENPMNR